MSLPKAASFSNSEINKSGKILIKDSPGKIELVYALDVLDKWRVSHAYPMNTFQATLRKKIKLLSGEAIVAQRLKRLPTIVAKLKKYPEMELSRMQDIGGLRAIVDSVDSVRKLHDIYQKAKFDHELKNSKDYISDPKRSGYRGIHLIYKYKNKQFPSYDGLSIELQFRSKLQHSWATAVETMGTFLGKALKSSQGNKEWLNFFALTSSAFAHLEKTPRIPGYEKLSRKQTFEAVIETEKTLGVISKMRAFTIAANMIHNRSDKKGWYYHLIILDSINKIVRIQSFSRDQLKAAASSYAKAEKRARSGEKIEPVLVSAGPLESLHTAYPNYFLDTKDFINELREILNYKKV